MIYEFHVIPGYVQFAVSFSVSQTENMILIFFNNINSLNKYIINRQIINVIKKLIGTNMDTKILQKEILSYCVLGFCLNVKTTVVYHVLY